MILCCIKFYHYSPKDYEGGIKEYVVAYTPEQVEAYVDKEHLCGELREESDDNEHSASPTDEWIADNQNKLSPPASSGVVFVRERYGSYFTGSSQALSKWLKGTWWQNVEDAYYGVTHWDWSSQQLIGDEDVLVLFKLGIAKDIRGLV